MNSVYMDATTQSITPDIIKELVEEHYSHDVKRYKHFYDLYKGEHEIKHRTMTDPNKPNNKLVNDYFGQIVDDTIGYFLGKPIVFTLDDADVQDALVDILEDNDADDLFLETGKEMIIKGKSAIMIYQDEDGMTKLVRIPPEELILIYDSSKTNVLLYAIRVFELSVVGKDEKVRYAEVYSDNEVTYYFENDGHFILDTERPNPTPHIFKAVPIVPFYNNEEGMSDLAKIESLVNDFNKVFSDASNEHEAFRNAYLMLKNLIVSSDTLTKLKESGVIEVDADGDVKFITKEFQTEALENHLNRLEDNIYRFAQVPNLADENFSNNLSGVAIKFKLFGLENKCIIKERKMTKGIKTLLKLLSVPISVKLGKSIEPRSTQIQFVRNLPSNVQELADTVSKLTGIVDTETLLGLLPFVDNPQLVMEKLEWETNVYKKDLLNSMEEDEVDPEDEFESVMRE